MFNDLLEKATMKFLKHVSAICLCLATVNVSAAQKAVTEQGDVVILSDNGTWFYEQSNLANDNKIKTNTAVFNKPASANFVLKSKTNNASVALNSKEWTFAKGDGVDTAVEYNLSLKKGDLYARLITERIKLAPENLSNIAFENAKKVAPDLKLINKEYRVVNGHQVIYMVMAGTSQGIKFNFLGYYFSDQSGSTQFVVFTSEDLVERYQTEISDILNGFSVQ